MTDEYNLFTVFDGDETNEEGNRRYPELPPGKIAVFFDKQLGGDVLEALFASIGSDFHEDNLHALATRAAQWAQRVSVPPKSL